MSKRKYGEWSEKDMELALKNYREKNCGFNETCKRFNIPKPTFKRHLESKMKRANEEKKLLGRSTTLPPEVESELKEYLLHLEECFFGVSITDVRKAAFEIADRNKLPHTFSKEKKMAGKKWYYAFMRRHPDLSLRQPESTSMARSKGFNRQNVYNFFDILEKICDENKIIATKIFNVDESGFSTVQKRCQKVIAQKGKHRVGAVTSGERGVNTTVVCCISAAGQFVPPMIIFKRKRMANELKKGVPPGSLVEISDTGYINTDLFVKWLTHFIETVKPTKEDKVLLVLDGHTTHSRNLEALNMARDNGVILLQLPGHTTHRLQPLDVAVFKTVQSNYIKAIDRWLRTYPGQTVSQYDVSELIGEAYVQSATVQNAISGFRDSGLWPVNRSVFNNHDFAPADNLASLEEDEHVGEGTIDRKEKEEENETEKDNEEEQENEADKENEEETEIRSIIELENRNQSRRGSSSSLDVPISEILGQRKPPPKLNKRQGTGAQKVEVLTSSPYKIKIQAAKEIQAAKIAKSVAKRKLYENTPQNPTAKKQKQQQNKNSKAKKEKQGTRTSNKPGEMSPEVNSPRTSRKPTSSPDPLIEVNIEEWFCFLCGECHLSDMIRCERCQEWAHEECAGFNKNKKQYVCDVCTV